MVERCRRYHLDKIGHTNWRTERQTDSKVIPIYIQHTPLPCSLGGGDKNWHSVTVLKNWSWLLKSSICYPVSFITTCIVTTKLSLSLNFLSLTWSMYSTPYVFNSSVAKQHPSGTPQSKRTQSFFLMQATFFFFCCILGSVSSIQSPWPSQPSAIGCMIFFLREKERESLCVRVRVCVCVCVFSHESHYVFMLNLHLCLQARQNECNALHNNYIFH